MPCQAGIRAGCAYPLTLDVDISVDKSDIELIGDEVTAIKLMVGSAGLEPATSCL